MNTALPGSPLSGSPAPWTEAQRDEAYTRLCHALSAAAQSPQGESLFLARLALLLAEEVGDLPRVLKAIEAAGVSV